MKKFLLLALFSSSVNAAIVTGTGSSSSCELARGLAVRNALEKYAGQEFDYKKQQSCKEVNFNITCTFEKSIDVDTAGTLKKVLQENVTQDTLCNVTVKVEVERSRLYELNIDGKHRYFSGEPLQFIFETKEPLYLYIFNVYYNGLYSKKVNLVYPTDRLNNNLIDGKFVFPGSDKVRFTTYVESGDYSKEQLVFLFTKYKLYDRKEWSVVELENVVRSIPTYSRRVVYQDILIERRLR